MRKFIHIRSSIPAIISINGEPIKQQNLDIMSQKDFYIAFFPISQEKYLPCAISTNSNYHPSSIKQIPYKDNHYEILFTPSPLPVKGQEICILNKKYNNCIFNITNNNESFITISANTLLHSSTTFKLECVNFKNIDGYAIISGNTSSNLQYLLIFNTKNKKILVESLFDTIEINKTELKALKRDKIHKIYGKVYNFNFENKKLSSYNVYTEATINPQKEEIVPFEFLKSLQYGDFKQCLALLDNKDATPEKLKLYFGKIDEIYFNGYSNEINYTVLTDNKYKNFTFHIANNKIIDIEENPL
jgi:hypothetical protein